MRTREKNLEARELKLEKKETAMARDINELKTDVHKLTNLLQVVIGYLELEDYEKSLVAAKDCIKLLNRLAVDLLRLASH